MKGQAVRLNCSAGTVTRMGCRNSCGRFQRRSVRWFQLGWRAQGCRDHLAVARGLLAGMEESAHMGSQQLIYHPGVPHQGVPHQKFPIIPKTSKYFSIFPHTSNISFPILPKTCHASKYFQKLPGIGSIWRYLEVHGRSHEWPSLWETLSLEKNNLCWSLGNVDLESLGKRRWCFPTKVVPKRKQNMA